MEASSAAMVRQGLSEEVPLELRAKRGEAGRHAKIWVKALQREGMPCRMPQRAASVEGQVEGRCE